MATTSSPQIYYPETGLQVGEVADHLAVMAQSISDRIRETQNMVSASGWTYLAYPPGAENAGFGFNLAYKLGPDYVRLRGTWKRKSGRPVYYTPSDNMIAELPSSITNRISATTYFLAPSTGTSYVSLQCTSSTGKIEIKGPSRNGEAKWCSIDNWEIPLAKV